MLQKQLRSLPPALPSCQARFLTYSVVALNVVFAVLSIALFGVHQDKYITGLDVRGAPRAHGQARACAAVRV